MIRRFLYVYMVAGAVFILMPLSLKAESNFWISTPDGNVLSVPVKTLVDLRYRAMVQQTYDVSCGAASLATILKYYYGVPVTEQEIVNVMFELGDKEKIQKEGFSLLELKWFSQKRGFISEGYRIPRVENLRKLTVPAIALVNVRGYAHFVVIKAVRNDEVYVADPAFGNRVQSLQTFAREWKGVILVVLSPTKKGDVSFAQNPILEGRLSETLPILEQGFINVTPGPNRCC